MMKLKTLIVDDEPLARKGLMLRLQAYDDIDVTVQGCNGKDAIAAIVNNDIDLMFLDIQMPGLNGFDVIEAINNQGLALPMVVFVTAFDQYAIKAFEVHALDYILKPINEERLEQTIQKIRAYVNSSKNADHKAKLIRLVSDVTGSDCQQILYDLASNQPFSLTSYSEVLVIKDAGEVSRVPVKEIIWIDAAGDYMCVHTRPLEVGRSESTYILRKTMKQLEASLDPQIFIRNHRSTIVNKHYIQKLYNQINGEYYLSLKNGKELKVSRSYKEKVKQAINN